MLSSPDMCRLGSHLKMTTPTGDRIVLKDVSAGIEVQGPELRALRISFLACPETFQLIHQQQLFNMRLEDSAVGGDSGPEGIQLEATLDPALLPIIQENAADIFDAAVFIRHQSRYPIHQPICQTQSWQGFLPHP